MGAVRQGRASRGRARHHVAWHGKGSSIQGAGMSDHRRFIASPERTILLRDLRKLGPGQEVTFAALSASVGFDVLKHRKLIYSVRSVIQAEGGGTIDQTPTGFRRLLDTEVVNTKAPQYERKARGAARRGVRALAGVEYPTLTEGDKREHNVRMSSLGAIRVATSLAAHTRIRATVEKTGSAIDATASLKLFEKVG